MAWYAIYKEDTGKLLGTQENIDPAQIPAGYAFMVIAAQPDASLIWDTTTRTFIARPLSKDEIERVKLEPYYEAWNRWNNTLIEATKRGVNATVLSDLTAKVNTEWTQYVNAVLDWRNA